MGFWVPVFILFSIISIVICGPCSASALPNHYCVGSAETYKSIQEAINRVTGPGDIILITSDYYAEEIALDTDVPSGTWANPIEVKPYQTETVSIGFASIHQNAIFDVKAGVHHWWFHNGDGSLAISFSDGDLISRIGFDLNHDSNDDAGFRIGPLEVWATEDVSSGRVVASNGVNGLIIDGVVMNIGPYHMGTFHFHDCGSGNANLPENMSVVVRNCRLEGKWEHVYMATGRILFENNYVNAHVDYGHKAIEFRSCPTCDFNNIIVRNNIFEAGNIVWYNNPGVTSTQNIVIENNHFEGYGLASSDLITIYNNGGDSWSCTGVHFRNNVILNSPASRYVIYFGQTVYDVFSEFRVENNVHYNGHADYISNMPPFLDVFANYSVNTPYEVEATGNKPYPWFHPTTSTKPIEGRFYTHPFESPATDFLGLPRSATFVGPFGGDNCFHRVQPECSTCEAQYTPLPTCDNCVIERHSYEHDCSTCTPAFLGSSYPACDFCANERHSISDSCTRCKSEFSNSNWPLCDTCAESTLHDILFGCSQCVPELKPYPNCDECANENIDDFSGGCKKCKEDFLNWPACDLWRCFGILSNETYQVCSGHGNCIAVDSCQCEATFSGSECGTEESPTDDNDNDDNNDDDNQKGAKNNNNNGVLIVAVLVPVISCFFILFICVAVVVTMVLVILVWRILYQKKKLEKVAFMLEEEALENQETAKFSINKHLFVIKYEDLKLGQKIGAGGSDSMVVKAEWKGKDVAFKIFKLTEFSENTYYQFEKEVEILASVSHPNILEFYGATIQMGIVMRWAENGDLKQFLLKYSSENNGKPYELKERMRIINEVASAMLYLHGLNDIKTENVLVTKHYEAKLMDFGLSKIVKDASDENTKQIGTSVFMAPEVCLSGQYSEKADVFSFAILLWIVYKLNFKPYGDNDFQIEFKVAKDENIRPSLEDVQHEWMKSWCDNSKERHSFETVCEILKDAIESL